MLIGISGKAQSGKDTFARFFMYEYGVRTGRKFSYKPMHYGMEGMQSTSGIEVRKFADKLKEMVTLLTGIGKEQLEHEDVKSTALGEEWDGITPREMLQKLGTDLIRNQLNDKAWINALFNQFDPLMSKWVVTDVRFPNEALCIKSRGGLLVRVNNPNVKLMDHVTETALDDWKMWDLEFDNDKDLDKVQHFAGQLVSEMFKE